MADRTSAEIFGDIFTLLAEDNTEASRCYAYAIYGMSLRYDFTEDQMGDYAAEACVKLGIAKLDDGAIAFPNYEGYDALPESGYEEWKRELEDESFADARDMEMG